MKSRVHSTNNTSFQSVLQSTALIIIGNDVATNDNCAGPGILVP